MQGGVPKAIEISHHAICDALNGKITIDGSSVLETITTDRSDLALMPDLDSFRLFPIESSEFGNVAVLMCNLINPDGLPAVGCTRSILRKELHAMNMLGFTKLNIGFEPEFFLLNADSTHSDSGTYAEIENDTLAHIRREILFELTRIGIIPLTSHHERAPSAHEITYKYSDAMRTCDNLVLGMLITKAVAKRHGFHATFEPKPFEGINGNGLHTNISLKKNGKNIFAGDNGLSVTAKHFLAGILAHAKSLCYITNPTENSYKRLVKGFEAPVNICWGHYDRNAMIRIPKATGVSTRIEIRAPDSTMNPYLGAAVILRAGLDGINRKLLSPKPARCDDAKDIETLPNSLKESLSEFTKSPLYSDLHFLI